MRAIVTYNILVQIIGKIFFFIIAILSTALIARSLGPKHYGYYTVIFVYLSFVAVLIDLGLQTIAVREASIDEKNTGRIAGGLFWMKVVWGGLILVVSSILFSFLNFNEAVKTGFAIAAGSFFFVALVSVPNTIFQSKLKLHYSVLSEVTGQGAFLCLVAIIFFLNPFRHYTFYFYLTASIISAIITFLVGIFFASRLEEIKWRLDLVVSKGLLKSTLPLTAVILLSQIHFKGDSLLLSLLKPEKDVGIYGLAYKFFEASLIVPAILMTVVFPLLSRYHSRKEDINNIASKSFNLLAASGLSIMVLIYFLAPQLILWVGGKGFEEAIFPLRILGIAIFFGFINSIFANIVIASNRQKDILFISITGVSLNLILNMMFIPQYSYNACAIITAFSEFYGMAIMGYLAYKASGFYPFQNLKKNSLEAS